MTTPSLATSTLCLAVLVSGGAAARHASPTLSTQSRASAQAQVFAAERAFAKTMADRDHAAFITHLSKDAIFYGQTVTRGPGAVAAAWKGFFDGPTAPFSWEPTSVEVTDSGTLALSSGPVRGPDGKDVSTFNSVWRLEPDGVWRVVFDKGCRCPPPRPAADAR